MNNQIIKLPEKITKTLWVYVGFGRYNLNQIEISTSDKHEAIGNYIPGCVENPENYGLLLLKKVKFATSLKGIKVEDGEVKKEIIKALKAQKSAIQAEFTVKLQAIQDRLDKHLAIECTHMQDLKEYSDLPF